MRIAKRQLTRIIRHMLSEAMEDSVNSSLPIEKSKYGPYAKKNGPEGSWHERRKHGYEDGLEGYSKI